MQVVAQRLGHYGHAPRRTADEWLLLSLPWLAAAGGRLLARRDPTSWLRKRLLARAVRSGWAGMSRQDTDLVLTRYADEIVQDWPTELVALGLPERLQGKAAWLEAWRGFMEAWDSYRLIPFALVDAGTCAVVLGRIEASGLSSGAGIDFSLGQLLEFDPRNNLVVRERFFTDWAEAVAAAGLDPGLLSQITSDV